VPLTREDKKLLKT
jgi:ABC-type multidrug transport system ATPase subunit